MDSLQLFRTTTGLSQSDLADWLAISRTLLALVETDKRNLPTAALIHLSQFRHILEGLPTTVPVEETPITFPKKEKDLLQKAKRLGLESDRFRHQLRQLEEKMKVWKTALNLCAKLKTELWVQSDAPLLDAIDRFHQKTWTAWCEHGPRQHRLLSFYLNQNLEEQAFLEALASDFGKGVLIESKAG